MPFSIARTAGGPLFIWYTMLFILTKFFIVSSAAVDRDCTDPHRAKASTFPSAGAARIWAALYFVAVMALFAFSDMRLATALYCAGCATKIVLCSAASSFNAAIPRDVLRSNAFTAGAATDLVVEIGRARAPWKRARNKMVARWLKSIVD